MAVSCSVMFKWYPKSQLYSSVCKIMCRMLIKVAGVASHSPVKDGWPGENLFEEIGLREACKSLNVCFSISMLMPYWNCQTTPAVLASRLQRSHCCNSET